MFIWTLIRTNPAPELSRRITCDNGLSARLSGLTSDLCAAGAPFSTSYFLIFNSSFLRVPPVAPKLLSQAKTFSSKKVSARDSPMAIVLKLENVAKLVFFIRGEKVMLYVDLAKLYDGDDQSVEPGNATQQEAIP